ncbi:hypothetical protein [Nostoc sp. CALU 1950]|uniref:hypothetical protein n=1 Tax=Nostoc sp. CALU 1950 TaxID=3104321 RepID=UPI003EB7287B
MGEFTATLVEGEFLGQEPKPDYETICDRALGKLKMGRQSAASKAIDAFIRELSLGER